MKIFFRSTTFLADYFSFLSSLAKWHNTDLISSKTKNARGTSQLNLAFHFHSAPFFSRFKKKQSEKNRPQKSFGFNCEHRIPGRDRADTRVSITQVRSAFFDVDRRHAGYGRNDAFGLITKADSHVRTGAAFSLGRARTHLYGRGDYNMEYARSRSEMSLLFGHVIITERTGARERTRRWETSTNYTRRVTQPSNINTRHV